MSENASADQPVLRVLTPSATPEDVAAVVAVLAGAGSGAAEPEKPRSRWASPGRRVRQPMSSGPGAWVASGLPR